MLVLASFFPPTPFFFFLDACKCERYGKKGKLVEQRREKVQMAERKNVLWYEGLLVKHPLSKSVIKNSQECQDGSRVRMLSSCIHTIGHKLSLSTLLVKIPLVVTAVRDLCHLCKRITAGDLLLPSGLYQAAYLVQRQDVLRQGGPFSGILTSPSTLTMQPNLGLDLRQKA